MKRLLLLTSVLGMSLAAQTVETIPYRAMLSGVTNEYWEFSRPPYAVDPLDELLVRQARTNGVSCRLLIESGTLDDLHRARLFGRLNPEAGGAKYPWESPAVDLRAARRLIEKHGYLRRMEELEDAEAAAKRWA